MALDTVSGLDKGYFIATRELDGSPGRPIGNDDGAVMFFEELGEADRVRKEMEVECGSLGVFSVNMSFNGEVIIP